jgi:hypothetical protein
MHIYTTLLCFEHFTIAAVWLDNLFSWATHAYCRFDNVLKHPPVFDDEELKLYTLPYPETVQYLATFGSFDKSCAHELLSSC